MGESRQELLLWINELLQLNVTKIESLGSGAVYCQILDSIFGDIPMSRVKFDAKLEYQYLGNFKILQDSFKRHQIDKPIPVEGLIRCKMQDNLEFTQWLRRFWDTEFPGDEYDAISRRGDAGTTRGATPSSAPTRTARTTTAARAPTARVSASSSTSSRPAAAAGGSTARRPVVSAGGARKAPAVPDETLQALTTQMSDMRLSVEALEKERDFYFGKLREIEIIVAARLEEPEEGVEEGDILKSIQEILYQTEDGFEVPEGEEGGIVDEEETF